MLISEKRKSKVSNVLAAHMQKAVQNVQPERALPKKKEWNRINTKAVSKRGSLFLKISE